MANPEGYDPVTGKPLFGQDSQNLPATFQAGSDYAEDQGPRSVSTFADLDSIEYKRPGRIVEVLTPIRVLYYYESAATGWVPLAPLAARALRRVATTDNVFTNVSTPTQLPVAGDKSASDMSFVKRFGTTRLIVQMQFSVICTSLGAEQSVFGLININSVNTVVAQHWVNVAPARYLASGTVEVSGVPAGTHTVGPRLQSAGSLIFQLSGGRDVISYSITEAI